MYAAFIFDFDGVLVDTTEIQVRSLIDAIFDITNIELYDKNDLDIVHSTITTKDKLVKFANKGYFELGSIEEIYSQKKKNANKMMLSFNPTDYSDKIAMFQYLKDKNKKVAIVTNANRESTEMLLKHLDFSKYIDVLVTNNDVVNSKPHSEPYVRALIQLGCKLESCIIFEDSLVGLDAAHGTGAIVCHIKDVNETNVGLIKKLEEKL